MATQQDRPGTGEAQPKRPAPAPVDKSEESVAGEEDPGASNEELEEPAFNRLPPKPPAATTD